MQKSDDVGRSAELVARWACGEFDQGTVRSDGDSHETAYTYDSLGWRTQEKYGSTRTDRYTYDLSAKAAAADSLLGRDAPARSVT